MKYEPDEAQLAQYDAIVEANGRTTRFSRGRTVGRSTPMVNATATVTGRLRFTPDLPAAGALTAKALRSTMPHARVVAIDTTAAERVPGVVAVLTRADFARPDAPSPGFGPVLNDQTIVAMQKVRYAGDIVAAVAAETAEAAEAGVRAISVTYEPLPLVDTIDDALAPGAATVHDEPVAAPGEYDDVPAVTNQANVCAGFRVRAGDIEGGFARADMIFEGVYESPATQHLALEPHSSVAEFDPSGTLVVTSTIQNPQLLRGELARMFGLPLGKVRVIVPPLGGGFGAKVNPKLEPLVAALAWKTGRRVRITATRAEEFLTLTKHNARITVRTGVTVDGRITAREATAIWDAGAYADASPRLVVPGGWGVAGPYSIPNLHIDSFAVYTNRPPSGAYRGYGVGEAAWAYEQQMDEIADALGLDPAELRRRNLLRRGERRAGGEVMREAHWLDLLDCTAKAIGYDHQRRRTEVAPGLVRGRGLAVIAKATITPSASHAMCRMDGDGSLTVFTSSVEMGQGVHTVLAQIAAERLGLALDAVTIVELDTATVPYDQSSTSSRSTRAMGNALHQAAGDVRDKLLALAAEQLEIDAADLDLVDGAVVVRGEANERRGIPEVLRRAWVGSLTGEGTVITKGGVDPRTGHGVFSDHWHQGAASAEVEVDLGTGRLRLTHLHSVSYVGKAVNPGLVRQQLYGNAIMGLSTALHEELVHEDGLPQTLDLQSYSFSSLADLPERFEVDFLEEPESGPLHGLGETTYPAVMAAIGNAVRAALGAPVRRLPITPERILEAIEEARNADEHRL